MLARILHGWRDQRPSRACCGRSWRDLDRHRMFAHGEQLAALPCADCGQPSVGWTYDVMGDGQTINGIAVCAAHQEEQT